ncbi:MAG: hypothetical protein K2H76_05295 [Muribaculaceae bacterium]|nr:hypothetical protein [Muribaculaceae bacterium]
MSGCTRKVYVPVERVRTELVRSDTSAMFDRLLRIVESRRQREVKTDSLVDRENVTVVLNIQGDTVKVVRTKYIYRSTEREKELESENKTLRDSISFLSTRLESIKADSVPVIVPVERELSRWEQTKMDFGGAAMVSAVLLFVGLCIAVWWLIKIKK